MGLRQPSPAEFPSINIRIFHSARRNEINALTPTDKLLFSKHHRFDWPVLELRDHGSLAPAQGRFLPKKFLLKMGLSKQSLRSETLQLLRVVKRFARPFLFPKLFFKIPPLSCGPPPSREDLLSDLLWGMGVVYKGNNQLGEAGWLLWLGAPVRNLIYSIWLPHQKALDMSGKLKHWQQTMTYTSWPALSRPWKACSHLIDRDAVGSVSSAWYMFVEGTMFICTTLHDLFPEQGKGKQIQNKMFALTSNQNPWAVCPWLVTTGTFAICRTSCSAWLYPWGGEWLFYLHTCATFERIGGLHCDLESVEFVAFVGRAFRG